MWFLLLQKSSCNLLFLLSQKLELIKPGPLASALELQCVSSAAFVLLSLLFHFSKASRRCCGMLAQIRFQETV